MTNLTPKESRAVYDIMNALEELGAALGKLSGGANTFISEACERHRYPATLELWRQVAGGHVPGIPGRHIDFIRESIRWRLDGG
ncbi:hypothetical protein ABID21_002217 [Pseudorhizobium tarimense]|uniref:Uncharacterized protein n=1 Tax=Pseudorhizobium tarimense TaxID=1079109 RepID=A0ABV2H786_9HYPH|nr:hypothetical protein [Pseudorhizobium tarimense]MCJ8519075.1 hypothetical protein [Pseudorhizobium tarimense]